MLAFLSASAICYVRPSQFPSSENQEEAVGWRAQIKALHSALNAISPQVHSRLCRFFESSSSSESAGLSSLIRERRPVGEVAPKEAFAYSMVLGEVQNAFPILTVIAEVRDCFTSDRPVPDVKVHLKSLTQI